MNQVSSTRSGISSNAPNIVEMERIQAGLTACFKKNMEFFRVCCTELYERFGNYEPQELRLMYMPEGYLNMVNFRLGNQPVYPKNPEEFIEEQCKAYAKGPSVSRISFAKSLVINEFHTHTLIVNDLLEQYEKVPKNVRPSSRVPVGLMLMTGIGFGYQLEYFIKHLDLYHLCVFEPHDDSFYVSLHTIDWERIIRYFSRDGRSIMLFIGDEPMDVMERIRGLPNQIGLYNMVDTFIFRHFNSKKEEQFIKLYQSEYHLNAAGCGFFDDERTSFAHTISNLNSKASIFKQDCRDASLPPVFVLGNGPSLDNHVEFIRKNQDRAIIITCGTSISSLFKTGIKPDFHVEMERVADTTGWIVHGTTPEYRKGVTLLCLNTAPPNMLEIFDEICYAVKPNDLGEAIINEEVNNRDIQPLQMCNPTVVNAGVAYAINMGFKEIYLLGVDLGIMTDGKHHSKLSLYADLEEKTKTSGHSPFEMEDNKYLTKGNFGGEVSVDAILHGARVNIEALLRRAEKLGGKVSCYNPNNGAYINGAKPIKVDDIPEFTSLASKQDILRSLKEKHFYRHGLPYLNEGEMKDRYLSHFFDVRKNLTLKKKIKNMYELHKEFDRIYLPFVKYSTSNPVTTMLLRGSINAYFSLISRACMFSKNGADFQKFFKIGRSSYMTFLKNAYEIMDKHAFMHDETPDADMEKFGDERNVEV